MRNTTDPREDGFARLPAALREDDVQKANLRAAHVLELETLEKRQAARDELWVGNPMFIDETHPPKPKRLASLPSPRADVDHACAAALGRAQLRRASRVVENHDIGPPTLHDLDDGGGMKRGRRVEQRGRKRSGTGIGRLAAQHEQDGRVRPARLDALRDGQRTGVLAHAELAGHRHEQEARRPVTQTR